MADVTVAAFEQMDPIYDGLARRARGRSASRPSGCW